MYSDHTILSSTLRVLSLGSSIRSSIYLHFSQTELCELYSNKEERNKPHVSTNGNKEEYTVLLYRQLKRYLAACNRLMELGFVLSGDTTSRCSRISRDEITFRRRGWESKRALEDFQRRRLGNALLYLNLVCLTPFLKTLEN